MSRRGVVCLIAVLAALGVWTGRGAAQQQAPPQQPPVFRAGTLVVPLDVRVTDNRGRPITGLTAKDFVVIEDNVRQPITQFIPQQLEPGEPAPLTIGARFMNPDAPPSGRRGFLIVLGRGRLQYPGRGVDGAMQFVSERLLPQDHVAVMAWDRATSFTTEHAHVLSFLERFKLRHEAVEATIQSSMSGLAAAYGSRDYPPSVRSAIDHVFAAAELAPATAVGAAVIPDVRSIDERQRRAVGDIQRAAATAGTNALRGVGEAEAAEELGDFDTYVETALQSMQDLQAIYRGIDYMRFLDGEKHLIYISPSGFTLPSADSDRSLAAVASDARVAVNIIMTGGTRMSGFNWAASSARRVSELTGGFFTSVMHADQALDRVDAMSRSAYVLGYSPINTNWNGAYRRLEVRVNRPGAVVHYRRGFFARPSRPPMDAAGVLSLTRISAATRVPSGIGDIEMREVFASPVEGANKQREVLIEFRLMGDRLGVTPRGDDRIAKFDLAVFVADERDLLVGQTWQTVDVVLPPARYDRLVKDGMPITVRVPIRRSSRNAKIIVYDYGSDLLGSALVPVRRRK